MGWGEARWGRGKARWGRGKASLVVAPLLLDVRLGGEELLAQHLERQMDTIEVDRSVGPLREGASEAGSETPESAVGSLWRSA